MSDGLVGCLWSDKAFHVGESLEREEILNHKAKILRKILMLPLS